MYKYKENTCSSITQLLLNKSNRCFLSKKRYLVDDLHHHDQNYQIRRTNKFQKSIFNSFFFLFLNSKKKHNTSFALRFSNCNKSHNNYPFFLFFPDDFMFFFNIHFSDVLIGFFFRSYKSSFDTHKHEEKKKI
jgi:hypothetical protein